MAQGLAAFLNSTIVDQYFRQFSGHTQANALDLKKLPYPPKIKLESLGQKLRVESVTQDVLDRFVEEELF